MSQLKWKELWDSKREELNGNYDHPDNWLDVINDLEERINKTHFEPIETLQILGELKGEGFSILTLQCALIETFAAFKKGLVYHKGRFPSNDLYYQNSNVFKSFLANEDEFKNSFHPANAKSRDISTDNFYRDVRCGLMHGARTLGNWTINAQLEERIPENQTDFTEKRGDRIRVDRKILNRQLVAFRNRYIDQLKNPGGEGNNLRRRLGRKLDELYGHKPDNVFTPPINWHWWNHA
jgi:hypothetical protein